MKQATLFKAWHSKGTSASEVPKPKDEPPDDMINLTDEDDEFLIQAMDETLAGNLPSTSGAQGAYSSNQKPLENLEGFDVVAGETWVYPTNYPVRSYQFNIVQSCLFKNTMVILPTGLGKTFIAAVVMYNFYRWYPNGKIVFMAPTRPLVAQQIEACYKIMGIPLHDTLEMTGTVPAAQRAQGWRERRVFFLTPQVMMNDLLRNALKPQDVKCLVIDEAHKALGSYSYCQVVQEIVKYNNQFRILALSATPGTDMKGVRNVLANLMISHVELRTEESIDLQPYTQKRTIEKVVVPLGAEIEELKTKFLGVIRTYLDRLERSGAIPRVNPESLGKYRMLLLKEGFQQDPPSRLSPREVGQLQGHFSLLISLYHAFELLLAHGMQPFFYFLKGIVHGEKSQPRVRYELMHNGDFEDLYLHLERRLGASKDSANDTLHPTAAATTSSLYENTFSHPGDQGEHVVGHPKLAKLEEIILAHFRSFAGNAGGTRVMVFSQYRDSVKEITAQLNRHQPVVKAMNFVGQRTGTAKGFSQREQLLVVRKFREGGYNVLVSTCVGEEGLDIGEIDLIVCFDAPKSPIRLVQRMGRTGRKREGRIVVLLTEGKEEQAYKESNYKKQNIHRAITNGRQLGNLYEQSPRMVPHGINPVCHRMHMIVPDYDTAKGGSKAAAKGRSILDFMTGKHKKSALTLNRQEELYYEAHYEVAPSTVPILPAASSRFLTLPQSSSSKHETAETERDKSRPRLSLSSWTQWQSAEQRSHFVSHSSKTELYVRIMRFIETARYADDDLDTYSLELKPFLQMEYVLSSDELLSPDPDLVDDRNDRDNKAAKPQRRRKYTKKKATSKKAEEETDREDEERMDLNRTEMKKKKKRVITDFFKDMSRSGEESLLKASAETATCEVDEEMDCQVVIEADDDCAEQVTTPERLDVDVKEEEELEEDPVEVEIRTPPRLDVDIFPSPGHALSPVNMAKIVFGEAGGSNYVTLGELVAKPTVETGDREVPDTACQSHRDRARSSNLRFSKLEIDSDLEDFFADDGFGDEQLLDSKKESPAEESLFAKKSEADRNSELKFDRTWASSSSPPAVEEQELVKNVPVDSFCDELFDSEADMFEDDVHVKADNKKEEATDPILISTQMPSLATKRDELLDFKDEMIADKCAALQLNDNEGRASSPITIPSQKLPPPVHSTPCRTVRLTTSGPAKSLSSVANASNTFGEPSPIRKAAKPERADGDWNILGDSDVELFGDASDGDHVSDRSDNASPDENCNGGGGQDMGITELCNFIEENSVVEATWKDDDAVFCRTPPPASNKRDALPLKSASGGLGTSRKSSPPASASRDITRTVSRVKSLSIKRLSDTSKGGLKAGDAPSERSSDLTELEGHSVLRDIKNETSTRTSAALNRSSARNSSAALRNTGLNETSASKGPSFELTVDWSGFESEDSLDEPAAVPTETLTQLRRTRESTLPPATLPASSITQSRNVPVALVKPMVSTASKAKKVVSTDEDSPIRIRKRPRQRQLSSGSSTASEPSLLAIRRSALSKVDDSDDDFQVLTCKKQQQTQRNTSRAESTKRKLDTSPTDGKSRKNSKKNRNDFIEHEANVSTDVINSSDESENSSLDQLDESFIDDQTQAPNKSIYLRTVRSPVGVAKFKIGHTNRVRYSEVFSQAVSEDEGDYIQDSFCVSSDDPSALHHSSSSASEKEEAEEAEDSVVRTQMKTRQRKRRIRVLSSEDESCYIESVRSPKTNVDRRVAGKRHCEQPSRAGPSSPKCVASNVSSCSAASLPGNRAANSPAVSASQTLSREERLQLQKIRQEEFRRAHMAGLLNGSLSAGSSACQSPAGMQVQADSTITIVVDTREIASGTVLVSTLRASKGVRVEVCSLPVGSLVLGRRCCVLRKSLADFGGPQNNSRTVDEVRRLFDLYDRPCVLLESAQRLKPGERPFKRTKYFDVMLAFLTSTHAKVLFSQSQGNTAELVLALAKREHQKGMALASADCLREKNQLVQFYLAFPMVSLATALSLTSAFPSVRALVNSSAEEVQERTKISGARAKDILNFCRTAAIL